MPASGIPQPTTLTLRPLTGGMRTDTESLLMPPGSFRDLKGFDVRTRGLRRIDGKRLFIPEQIPFWEPTEKVSAIDGFWGTDDAQFNYALTDRALYKIEFATPSGYFSPVWWQRQYETSEYVSGTGVLTVKTYNLETDKVRAGDFVVLASAPTVRYEIESVTGLTVKLVTGLTIPSNASMFILRLFQAKYPFGVDVATYSRSTANWMILVDGSEGGIYAYNGGYLKPFELHFPGVGGNPDTPSYTSARTVMYFGGRLYFGCVGLLGSNYRQRIIWTEVLDLQETPADAYQDLDETPGQILKFVGLGSLAFVYFNDGLYYGRQTNLAGLPYAFTRLDTGGVGLCGQNAATSFFDGQIFVAPDEIYYVTASSGLEAIGTPVLRDSIRAAAQAGSLDRTIVRIDIPRQRVLFGFSLNGGADLDRIFAYNYTTKAWSYMGQGSVVAFNVVNFADEIEYGDIDVNATYADYASVLFLAMGGSYVERQLTFVNSSGYVETLNLNSASDEQAPGVQVPISVVLETGDFDFDEPDTDKTMMELRVKLAQAEIPRSLPVVFDVLGSLDRGESWKNCGRIAIPASKNEGATGFRLTGSTVRFRLSSTSIVEPYEVSELTLRVVIRDREGNRGNTTSNP